MPKRPRMTKRAFKKRAEALFMKANPAATITGWIRCELCTFPTGVVEWVGKFYAVADGFKPSVMHVNAADDYVMVR